jgi:hypothetical protein
MAATDKHEAVFDLVKCMSKAEKRAFKLFATRTSGNSDAKFIALFDAMDSMDEYDQARVLALCPVKKEQLPNLKAHLYKQLLISLRLLGAGRSATIQLREQVDFAHILYDKGLYRESTKFLERAAVRAVELQQPTIALNVIDFQRNLETLKLSRGMSGHTDALSRRSDELCAGITATNELANIAIQLYDLYQKLGYARTRKDLDLLEHYYGPKLKKIKPVTFLDRFYFYQSMAWYSYVRHDFVRSYRYACLWVALFDSDPDMKELMYDSYLRGYSRILDGIFLMRKHRVFVAHLERFELECLGVGSICDNAIIISRNILYTSRINRYFIEGRFREGMAIIPRVEEYLARYANHLTPHYQMMMRYKIACLLFGNGDYARCLAQLALVTGSRDPQMRRDLQCYAKILALIASYELGRDYNLEYQIRSVYSFLIKMNDLGEVQKIMLQFLKRLGTIYASDLNAELRHLYERLQPYENHPYERRTFYYLDILSWLESKLTGRSVADIIRARFLASEVPGAARHTNIK